VFFTKEKDKLILQAVEDMDSEEAEQEMLI